MATETEAHKDLNAHKRKAWRDKPDHRYNNTQHKLYAWGKGRPANFQESGLTQAWQTQAWTTVDPATITGDPVTHHELLEAAWNCCWQAPKAKSTEWDEMANCLRNLPRLP